MKNTVRVRLSLIMLLEYFIWGAWYVTMGTYLISSLEVTATQVGAAYANLSIAAIISPFFVGLVADRFFSAQKVLGTLHLLGAATLYYISTVAYFQEFWWLILLYTLLYMPTMSLVNSISFSQMEDPDKDFPKIRVLGSVGWIAAGLLIGLLELETSYYTFRIAAYCSVVLGILSFFLPSTLPTGKKASISSILGLDALVLFKKKSFVVFFVSSILVCIPLAFYYNFANPFLNDMGMENAAAKMTMGQVSELLFMLLMPFAFRRLGIKKMMLIGIFAWVIRYLFFAYGDIGPGIWMLYGGILLHGVCYDFFFVSGQIYIDKKAKSSFRNAAQGLITFATYGVGMFIGSYVSGGVTDHFYVDINGILGYQWESIWLIPTGIAVGVGLMFLLFFREQLLGSELPEKTTQHGILDLENRNPKQVVGCLADDAEPDR